MYGSYATLEDMAGVPMEHFALGHTHIVLSREFLVGGFQPFKEYGRQLGSSSQRWKIKDDWNHQPHWSPSMIAGWAPIFTTWREKKEFVLFNGALLPSLIGKIYMPPPTKSFISPSHWWVTPFQTILSAILLYIYVYITIYNYIYIYIYTYTYMSNCFILFTVGQKNTIFQFLLQGIRLKTLRWYHLTI